LFADPRISHGAGSVEEQFPIRANVAPIRGDSINARLSHSQMSDSLTVPLAVLQCLSHTLNRGLVKFQVTYAACGFGFSQKPLSREIRNGSIMLVNTGQQNSFL
jgi:hypothetical protein